MVLLSYSLVYSLICSLIGNRCPRIIWEILTVAHTAVCEDNAYKATIEKLMFLYISKAAEGT